jgi:hypothetical protein
MIRRLHKLAMHSRATWMTPIRTLVVGGVLTGLTGPALAAQAPAAKKPATSAAKPGAQAAKPAAQATVKPGVPSTTKGASKAPAAPPSSAELAARDQVLQSEEWRETLERFNAWLAKQSLYDAEQVARTRLRLEVGIKRMSAAQLQRFMAEMHSKLEVLENQHAIDAQEYLSETLSVASPAYARKVRQQLPDVLSMSAGQIDQKLASITAKRAATTKMQQTFINSRQRMIALNEAQTRSRQREQAAEGVDRGASYPSNSNYTPAADYYPNYYDAFDTGMDGYAGVNLPLSGDRF